MTALGIAPHPRRGILRCNPISIEFRPQYLLASIEIIQPGHRQIDYQINTADSRDHPMGTLHCFPAIPKTRRDPHFQHLSQIIPDLVRQQKSIQKLAEAQLLAAFGRLETALAGIDAISCLLPPGEFKTQFDLDRSSLSKQIDLAKSEIVGLREQKGS